MDAPSTAKGFHLLQLYQGPGSDASAQTHTVWGTNKKNWRHAHACMGVISLASHRNCGGALEWKVVGFS